MVVIKEVASTQLKCVSFSYEDGAIRNIIYQPANDLSEPSTAAVNFETVNRSIDKRKINVNRQIVGYDIVGKLTTACDRWVG